MEQMGDPKGCKWQTWPPYRPYGGWPIRFYITIKLFPYLKKFKADAERADTIEYKISVGFSEVKIWFKVSTISMRS